MTAHRSEDGSAALLVCGLLALAILLALAVASLGGAVVLAGRAEAAADAAALAAADQVALGNASAACGAARTVAASDDARLVDCEPTSEAVEVVVQLTGRGPAALGRVVRARSRAEIDLSGRPATGEG